MNSPVLCRICAKPQTQNMQKLFDIKLAKILKQFQKLTGKSLICEENLPQHICQCCLENLARAYDFRAKLLAVQHYYTTSQYLDTLLATQRKLDKKREKTKRIECKDEKEEVSIVITRILDTEQYGECTEETIICKAEEDSDPTVDKVAKITVEEIQYLKDEIEEKEESKSNVTDDHIAMVDELQNLENEIKQVEGSKSNAIKGVCQYCGKIFKYNGELGRHLRHHEGTKRFQCEYCEYRSYSRIHLKHHKMTHTGERPFPCSYCDKRFTSKNLMKRHLRIHENVRPFVCRYCQKGFSQGSILKAHLISHGESRFNCDVCVRSFQSNASLLKHYESNGHLKNIRPE